MIDIEKYDIPELSEVSKVRLLCMMMEVALDQTEGMREVVARLMDQAYELEVKQRATLEHRRSRKPLTQRVWHWISNA